jgi:hypothetical protein
MQHKNTTSKTKFTYPPVAAFALTQLDYSTVSARRRRTGLVAVDHVSCGEKCNQEEEVTS